MRGNRVAPPIDLMAELEGDDDDPKKQSTLTQQPTLVGPQTAPKPTLTTQKTTVQPTTVATRPKQRNLRSTNIICTLCALVVAASGAIAA